MQKILKSFLLRVSLYFHEIAKTSEVQNFNFALALFKER